MTFLTLNSANILHGDAIHFPGFNIIVVFFVNAIKFISRAVIIIKIHLCFAVAVYTPPHAQLRKLFYFIHFSNRSMAGLTLNSACVHMLRMTEENKIGQAMYLYPFNR